MSTHRSSKARPVATMASGLAAYDFFLAGLLLIPGLEGVPYLETGVAVGLLGGGAFGVLFGIKRVEPRVTPHEDVQSFKDRSGELTAGPAADEFVDDDEDPAATPPVGDVDSAGYPRI